MNKEINDDDLNLSTHAESVRGKTRDQIVVGPASGAAVKSIFAPANRTRLIFMSAVGVLIVAVIVYTFFGLQEEEVIASTGAVSSGQVYAQRNDTPSNLQKEELERYNLERLPELQAENPTAHPLMLTEPNVNPFVPVVELDQADQISDLGNAAGLTESQTANRSAGRNELTPEQMAVNDEFIAGIIEREGSSVPALQSVTWNYKAETVTAVGSDANQNEPGLSEASVSRVQAMCEIPAARAGSVFMTTSDLALNSDVGGPVSLTIRNGRLANSKLIGRFERKEEWLRLELDKLVTKTETKAVSAIGLDVDTTLNAVKGEVDSHLLYRYGWWGTGVVLSSIGAAAQANADRSVYISDGTVVESVGSDATRETKLALGALGQQIGSVMQDRINRPITVTIKSGEEVGVFFLDDVCLNTSVPQF